MKLILLLLVVPLVLACSVKPTKRHFNAENDSDCPEDCEKKVKNITCNSESIKGITVSDVEYDLYTQSNTRKPYTIRNNKVSDLQNTNFDPSKRTIFVIHGWRNNRTSSINTRIRDALFGSHNVNLFVVDWSQLAGSWNYVPSRNAVPGVGQIVGDFVNLIHAKYGLNGDNFVFIGHSLGAHVAGIAGSVIRSEIGNIIGMDPAAPCFNINDFQNRLDSTHGKVVQVIHTNAWVFGLGISTPIGHMDFYPNGGQSQPGCNTCCCSHARPYSYVAEAITRGASVFPATSCSSWDNYQKNNCPGNTTAFMADLEPKTYVRGNYYLRVAENPPYGLSSSISYQCTRWFVMTLHLFFLYVLRCIL